MIKDLKDKAIFGKVQAVVYTIEFQKRGLPHCHICLFLHSEHKIPTVDGVDPFIKAEIPNMEEDPKLYSLVKEFMIHGPCGPERLNCSCMISNKCLKNFPKRFCPHTFVDSNGFPVYMRREDGRYVEKSGVKLDNRNVVPYNPYLFRRYQAHINVEWCNQGSSIKYLFKYINKGPDRVTVAFEPGNKSNDNSEKKDEIKDYYDCRYVSACEASWRIFGYDVHYRTPSVMRLPFNLPNQQSVVYGEEDEIDDVLDKPSVASSKFTSWFECNRIYREAQNLTYVEFTTKFVWKENLRVWTPRKKGFSIGRILLNKVKSPISFEDIRTVNGQTYSSFRDACYVLGLLDDDREYIHAIEEASHAGPGYYLRLLFATMLLSKSLSRPEFVWENSWQFLIDEILHRQQQRLRSPDLSLSEDQLKNLALFEIEQLLLRNNSSLKLFKTMPYPDDEYVDSSNNHLISEELDYNVESLTNEFGELLRSLTDEQKNILTEIMSSVEHNMGGVFFVYGYGGTGKTFLWKTLSAALRSKGLIVLNVASSGIALLLLSDGRIAHSRFIIPINLLQDSYCTVTPDSEIASLLRKTSLIIWDEAPMTHRHAFEALDRTLKDIISSDSRISNLPFGGKVIVFGGDFRQILPVIPGGSRPDIVNASLSSSSLWDHCKLCKLTKNMRLVGGTDLRAVDERNKFAKWLLNIGEGKIGGPNDGEAIIDIPEDLLIKDVIDPVGLLIEFVYPHLLDNLRDTNYFQERAILAPKNEVVEEINDRLLLVFPGEEKEYLSSDSLCEDELVNANFDPNLYTQDVLNGLKFGGVPNHRLLLKVGVPVMLLSNIDQKMADVTVQDYKS